MERVEPHLLTNEELRELQKCLLRMLIDFINVCAKHNLRYFLCGGSALGSVRHNGFIPWDDDLDIIMPRNDYEKLKGIFNVHFKNNYTCAVPNSSYTPTALFMKIYKNGTICEQPHDISNKNKGIWLDISPIDNAPNNVVLRYIKGLSVDILGYLAVSRYIYQNRNEQVDMIYTRTFFEKMIYYLRMLIASIILIDFKSLYNFYDKFIQSDKKSNYVTIAMGRRHYIGECQPKDVFQLYMIQ